MQLLEAVGIPDKANVYPYALSGGQRQRLTIAKPLAMKPQLMFFDEPTSALDPEMKEEVLNVIRRPFPGRLPKLYAELGNIVSGDKPGREKESERILGINIGLALNDIIVANYIYEISKKRNTYPRLKLL